MGNWGDLSLAYATKTKRRIPTPASVRPVIIQLRTALLTILGASTVACASLSNLSGSGADASDGEVRDAASKRDAGFTTNDARGTTSDAKDASADVAPPAEAVLFGGLHDTDAAASSVLGDTWTFDGKTWSMVTSGGPSPRSGARGVSFAGALVLFGGSDSNGNFFNDLWGFTQKTSWTQLWDGTGTAPSARASPGVANLGKNIIVFGGYAGNSDVDVSDTWQWNGTAWTQLHPTSAPPKRSSMMMATLGDTVVVFGGINDLQVTDYADTWVFDGTNWTRANPTHAPPARSYPSFATAATGAPSILLFGGLDDSTLEVFGDMWSFDGTDWTQLQPSELPVERADAVMAPVTDGVLLFGGSNYDGSSDFADTWLWSGSTWSEVATSGPPPRSDAVMAAP
jgi:N-acetylneuraminic acid mutarotase